MNVGNFEKRLERRGQYHDFYFVSDSQDVNVIKQHVNTKQVQQFDAFFVAQHNDDYESIYGIHGIIPFLSKTVTKITLNNLT
jgi:glutamate synthase domain-containing protein 1